MPIQHLGTTPAQTSPLTQMLQGLAGGVQTGMGYYQQAQQQKSVLAQLNLEQLDKTAETAWEMWNLADESGKSAIESGIKTNPELLALMEDRFYWVGGPEGGFVSLKPPEVDIPTFKATKLGDDVLLYNETDPEDTHIISAAEKSKETEWVEGETGYFAPKLEDGTLGDTVYVGHKKDTSDIHVYEQAYGLIYVDESDPSNPVVIKQVLKPTEDKTPAELLKERNEKIKLAWNMTVDYLKIKYPESWADIVDEKGRARIGAQLGKDATERWYDNLVVMGFSETDATKISRGMPFPMDVVEIYDAWVNADVDRKAEIEMMVRGSVALLAQAEARPNIWNTEVGGFIEPLGERSILEQLLYGVEEYPEAIKGKLEELPEHWKALKEKVTGVAPEEPAEKGALYTPEINAEVEEDKKYAEENPGALKAMQTTLKEKGYWDYNITGKWTPTWEKAVRQFYRDQLKKGGL